MKTNATAREEEVRRFPDRYIDSVKILDGLVLRSSREMRDAFQAHFRDHFARCPDLPLQEFRRYLADFPRLGAASCEGVVTECEVRDALKQVFVSRCLDIRAVKKAVGEYERIAGAKVNFDKSEGLRLGAWRGAIPFQGPSTEVTDPSASSGYGSGPNSN